MPISWSLLPALEEHRSCEGPWGAPTAGSTVQLISAPSLRSALGTLLVETKTVQMFIIFLPHKTGMIWEKVLPPSIRNKSFSFRKKDLHWKESSMRECSLCFLRPGSLLSGERMGTRPTPLLRTAATAPHAFLRPGSSLLFYFIYIKTGNATGCLLPSVPKTSDKEF